MKTIRNAISVLLLLTALAPMRVAAETQSDDLKKEEDRINRDVGQSPPDKNAATLAERFQVPQAKVEELHSSGKGWGAVTIELALAEKLAKTDPTTYPTTLDGLAKVDGLRSSGLGYGQISHQLGFKLGDVVSAVHQERVAMVKDMPQKPEHLEHMNKPDHPTKPEHMEHPGGGPKQK